MITIKTWNSIFDNNSEIKYFYRNGQLIGQSQHGVVRQMPHSESEHELSRAQGYKYWTKYFKGRYCWDLPEALQRAIEMPCTASGSFIRNGEVVGYEG